MIDIEPLLIPSSTFDPAKRFRFTWPGQPTREVGGDELTEICKGAVASMLAIEPVEPARDARNFMGRAISDDQS